jgi:hypothetical protein
MASDELKVYLDHPKFVDPDLATEPQQLRLTFFDDPDFR